MAQEKKKARPQSVWDALEDTPEAAANMKFRSKLLIEAQNVVKAAGLTQSQAAKRAGVTQPRMSDLMRGRIEKFTIDALINVLDAFNRQVEPVIVEVGEEFDVASAV